jgi:hypothetical protein
LLEVFLVVALANREMTVTSTAVLDLQARVDQFLARVNAKAEQGDLG